MTDQSIMTAFELIKQRLNRADTALDEYLEARVRSAAAELERIGIALTDSIDDIMLVADYAAWQYLNRDKPGMMPEWLRLMRRERWLSTHTGGDGCDP